MVAQINDIESDLSELDGDIYIYMLAYYKQKMGILVTLQ